MHLHALAGECLPAIARYIKRKIVDNLKHFVWIGIFLLKQKLINFWAPGWGGGDKVLGSYMLPKRRAPTLDSRARDK